MATHQYSIFYIEPKFSHERAIHMIGRYLKGKGKGVIFKPNKDIGVECYMDTDVAGGWDKDDSGSPEAVLPRTRYDLMYSNYSILWCSKLQT